MAFAHVQSVMNTAAAATSCVITVAATSVGNIVCVGIKLSNTTSPPTNVAVNDDKGNTYSDTGLTVTGAALAYDTFQFYGIQATGGTTSVTVSWTNTQNARCGASEFSGTTADQANVYETGATGENTSGVTAAAVATFSPTSGNLIFAFYGLGGGGSSITAGTNYLVGVFNSNGSSEYRLSSGGSETAPLTWTTNMTFRGSAGSYRPANPAGGAVNRIRFPGQVSAMGVGGMLGGNRYN